MANHDLAPDELDLRDYLAVLRRRKLVIALAVFVVVAGALTASLLQTPVYSASTEVLLKARSSETLFDPQTGQPSNPQRAVDTEIQVMESAPVERLVQEELGVGVPSVDASVVGDTDVVELSVEHTDPEMAARISNAYAQTYISYRRDQNVEDLLAAAAEIQDKIDELQAQIDSLDAQAAPEGSAPATGADGSQRGQLVSQQAVFKQQLDQLQVGAALTTGGAQVVAPAEPPGDPVRPTPLRTGILALVVGSVFGVGLAFLFDYLDDSIRGKDDVDRSTGGVPALGVIPVVTAWKKTERPWLVSLSDPESSTAEAYRALRTSLQFLSLDRTIRKLQVTSTGSGEGKTTTVANLGVLFARSGHRVVVVDCDLRRPRIHEFFGLSNEVGFTTAMLGDTSLSAAIQDVPEVPRLSLLASGPIPALPSELLSTYRTGEIIQSLEGEFDVVLIDSPPVLPVTDATVLAGWVDGTMVVATADMTSRRSLTRTIEVLQQVEAPLMGVVLNKAHSDSAYADGYGYGYRYKYKGATPPRTGREVDEGLMRPRSADGPASAPAAPPVEPAPVEPAPVEPEPVEPEPVEAEPGIDHWPDSVRGERETERDPWPPPPPSNVRTLGPHENPAPDEGASRPGDWRARPDQ